MFSIKNFSFLYRYYYLLLIPILVMALFSKVFIQRQKAMQIAIYSEAPPFLVKHPKRIFQTVQLRGDEFDSSKMEYFRTLIVEIYKRKDTTYGVQLNFDPKTEYQHIVRAFDLCHIFDMRYFNLNPEKNMFWACYEPARKQTHIVAFSEMCGTCRINNQNRLNQNDLIYEFNSFINFFKDFHNKEGQFDSEFPHTIHCD